MTTTGVPRHSQLNLRRRGYLPAFRLHSAGFLSCLIIPLLSGCGGSTTIAGNASHPQDTAEEYVAGAVGNLQSYKVDHTANTFVVTSYSTAGATIQDSGSIGSGALPPALTNGIYDLDITYGQGQILEPPPFTNGWLVEEVGDAALTEMETTNSFGTYTSFAPLVPAQSCPSLASSQTFQFVTVPKPAISKPTLIANGWNPQLETAYGSVSISTTGESVKFTGISQLTLPSANGGPPEAPVNPANSTASAVCSSGFLGETISYPSSVTVDNPGSQGNQSSSASATIAIGPTGFLVEDDGAPSGAPDSSLPPYENLLGAGYGAIGIPKPSGALTTSSVASAQYQGILYGAASGSNALLSAPGFRLIASFGYQNLQTACPTLPGPSTSTVLYGGEFANNDPSANAYGNCDLAIDLGSQDSASNGLYSSATVYVSASFPGNGLGAAYSFPAVAVAGQVGGKYAILLIGMDTIGVPAQPWGIYLLQSN